MDAEDTDLLRRYRRGDVAALEQLVAKYRRPLYGFIHNMTGGRDDADDIFQEVWLRVIAKFSLYRPDNFFGWLVRIARNLMIDRVRRRKDVVSLDAETPDGGSLADTLAAPGRGPGHAAAAGELAGRIRAAVDTLPPEQKEVFLLRVQTGMPFKDIAVAQKVSINTALARMQYALAKLRPLLARDYAAAGER
jgi:RNA polymerase sigma-70 factor (ECF subfamily)